MLQNSPTKFSAITFITKTNRHTNANFIISTFVVQK